jgi:hypothetical protein
MYSTITGRIGSAGPRAIGARGLRRASVVLAALLVVSSAAHAQVLYGSITGNVADTTGAFLPGVSVQARNVGTGVAKTAVTDERGAYVFSDLLPGDYDVVFELSGFTRLSHKGARVDTNAVRRVDATLNVSAVSESVEVTAATQALQTDRADLHITQTSEQVSNLPLSGTLGRNYQSLMQVVPGAVIVRTENGGGEANSVAGSPQRSISFSANGVSGWNNQTRIDGSPVQYVWLPTNTAYVPSPEAIEEVSIVTNSYTAEVGMAGGAAVNVVVKSGTNNYRGTGWIYDTDATLRARNVFQTTPDNPKNIVMQYGGNTGGRIVRDKLFYFFNAEKSTQRVAPGSRLLSIAPANLRPGAGGGVVFPMPSEGGAIIYDPASNPDPALRTPFPDNTIPANRIDQAARYLTDRLPATTGPGYVNNVTTTGATTYDRTNYDLKINYASSRLNLFGRYGNSPHLIDDQYALGDAGGGSAAGGSVGVSPGRTQVLGLGATYVLSSTTLLDVNFGYTHQVLGSEAPDIGVNVGSDSDKMNIPGTNGPDPLQGGLPSFQIQNWANLGNDGTGNPFQFRDNQYSFAANLQKQVDRHLLRGGFEWLDQQINHFQPQGGIFQTVRGTFIFDGQSTMLQNVPAPADTRFNSWASFLLGQPSQAGKVDQLVNPNSLYMKTYSAYVQDTWQASANLTVAFGLRWEHQLWPTRPDGLGVNRFDPTDGYVYLGGVGGTPQDTNATTSGVLMPRLGATYRLADKTVVRGGYALGADNSSFINFRNAYPSVFAWSMPPINLNGVQNQYIPVTTLRQGLIVPGGAPDISQGRLLLPTNVGTTTYPVDLDRGKVHSFNVTVEHEVLPWLTAQASYVGTRATGQMNFVNINAGAPGTGNAGRPLFVAGLSNVNSDINSFQPYGDTVYDGLQTQVRARSRSAQGTVVYTWSETTNYVDNAGGNAAGAGGPRIQYLPEKERNKGLAGYDRTHNFQAFWAYNLPFGREERWATGGWKNAVFGGWQLNGVWTAMSGTPIYIVQDTPFNLNAAGSRQVPDLIADTVATYPDHKVNRPPAGANPNDYQYFDRSAYQVVNIAAGAAQRFGTSPRNTVRGPGFWNVDLGFFRSFTLPRTVVMQFRFEMLNALNHANYRNPGNNVSDPGTFGFITETTGVGERNIRLGLRVTF